MAESFPPTESRSSGTVDDDDNPGDERDGENEAPVRETRDRTEAPEEFTIDDGADETDAWTSVDEGDGDNAGPADPDTRALDDEDD